uniref:Ubiquitin carboxyl-terminal hydrolase n=1 Tax=Noctiluca scintillans TaxID=2966 RepID=A0A7S1FB39_NOCSC
MEEDTGIPPAPAASVATYQEHQLYRELEQKFQQEGLEAGQHYYLINRKWQIEWLQWVGHNSTRSPSMGCSPDPDVDMDGLGSPSGRNRSSFTKERPGPIDNAVLLEAPSSQGRLRRNILEKTDYEIISKELWDLLFSWYGGGPPIKRRANEQSGGTVMVELFHLTVNLYLSSDPLQPTTMIESKMTTVAVFKRRACEELGVDFDKVRIWDYFNKKRFANLEEKMDKSLDDCRIFEDNDILLELQNEDGTWPSLPDEQPRASYSGGSFWTSQSDNADDVPTLGTPLRKGAVGLRNLGNTCFMNSSLQCLSNVPELRDFFVSDKYKPLMNPGAFKTKGKLAESFSKLLSQMWGESTIEVAPRNFKWQIGQFAEQFAGYGQQDSMEFVEYLLDGLKEDVNKVREKPYVEIKEADGREDVVVAEERKIAYQMRNNSFIDDLFMGLFKSTVTCPSSTCGRVSVTFDPFLSVKLSLSSAVEDRTTSFEVTVVPRASSASSIRRHKASVMKFGNVGDIIDAVAKEAGFDPKDCILTEIFSKKIYKFFELTDAVDSIRSNDILVLYELEDAAAFQVSSEHRCGDKCGVVIQHRQQRSMNSHQELLGIPLITCVNKRIEARELIDDVKLEVERRIGQFNDASWKLYRTSDRHNIERCRDCIKPDDGHLTFESRQYLVVEWDDSAVVPEALSRLLEGITGGSSGSTGSAVGRAGSVELGTCFQMFTETDKLSAMDAWYCNRCKELREAYKKMEFWTLPPVLVLQLKRFTYTQFSRDRLDTAVVYPLEGLDLGPHVLHDDGESQLFDLLSVSKHMGGLGGGHYVAYARSSEDGCWYYYDDTSVSKVRPEDVASQQVGAYVLFYLRRSHRPTTWGAPA